MEPIGKGESPADAGWHSPCRGRRARASRMRPSPSGRRPIATARCRAEPGRRTACRRRAKASAVMQRDSQPAATTSLADDQQLAAFERRPPARPTARAASAVTGDGKLSTSAGSPPAASEQMALPLEASSLSADDSEIVGLARARATTAASSSARVGPERAVQRRDGDRLAAEQIEDADRGSCASLPNRSRGRSSSGRRPESCSGRCGC